MSKIAFVFPGQGSQTVGMCKAFYYEYPVVKQIFEEADDALGYSISKMCFEGPAEDLKLTANTQPAILTASTACAAVLKEHGVSCDIAAGHSLGEYSALVNTGALKFADAVRIVNKRGQFMQEAVPVGEGSMAAILGLDSDKIVEICRSVEAESGEAVQAVNFNCPGQVVIAGAVNPVNKAIEALKAAGAKRALPLKVGGAFHSPLMNPAKIELEAAINATEIHTPKCPVYQNVDALPSTLMQPAAARLAEVLAPIEIKDITVPVVANVTAQEVTSGEEIKKLLVKQAAMPVLWETSVRNMVAGGVDIFVEVGPGKVLTGFTKKIAKGMMALNVEDAASLEKTLAELNK